MSDRRRRLRSSLRYVPASGFPAVVAFPFARIDFYADALVFSAAWGVPFGRPKWSVDREKIQRVQRTRRGVRFYADGFKDPWVVASLFPKYFLRRLAEQGIVPDDPIVQSRWNTA